MSEETGARNLGLGAVLAAMVLLVGCGRYADFTLPPPEAQGPASHTSEVLHGEPVVSRGSPGEWDSSDALNPSVVQFQGSRWMLYSGYDGRTWRTGVAVEENGGWQKRGVILSPKGWEGGYIAANGSALVVNGELWYWYEAGDPLRVGLARSKDGKTWRKEPQAVLGTGPYGSFDESAAADPYVIRAGGEFYLFYLGQDRARRQRLGVARSHDGIVWEKLRSNPVLELGSAGAFDENGLGEPAVWASGGRWWMFYTGRDRGERRRIGLAESDDGVRWKKDPGFAPMAGGERWNAEVVCDPHVEIEENGVVRMWYGGGNAAKPAEGLDGAIGVAEIRLR